MTAIDVPARIGEIPELEAEASASSVTTALRGCATAVSDVASWSTGHGAPADWSGEASEAADHAMTVFGRDADAVTAALERATTACDVYVEQVVQLTADRVALDADRIELNNDVDALVAEIEASTAADVPALQAKAATLRSRASSLRSRITAFWDRVTAAEDRFIAVLQSVDTEAEAAAAATSGGRPDTGALLDRLREVGTDPAAITAWWKGLSAAEREALKISDPGLVGNVNGIPTGDRDEANRASLQRDLDFLAGLRADGEELSDQERTLQRNAEAAMTALRLGSTNVPPVDTNLVVYGPLAFGGDGAVAVAYGDPDTADHTAVVVPGLTNDGSKIAGQGQDALNLYNEAVYGKDDASVATIAWMGYDAPSGNPVDLPGDLDDLPGWASDITNLAGVTREDLAEEGGHRLSGFVDGLRATHEGDRAHLTVIGHSYGSTTAAHAAVDGLDEDSLVLLGSPGAGGGVDHASDLAVPGDRVYVGSAENDPVTWLGRDGRAGMGNDPSQAAFGGTRIAVDDGREFHLEDMGGALDNHTSYFDPVGNRESVDNVAKVVMGEEPTVVAGRDRDANDYARDWAEDELAHQADRARDAVEERIDDAVRRGRDAVDDGADWLGDRWDDVLGRR